jgi:hypothetical protein
MYVLSREKIAPCANKSVKAMSGIMLKPTRSIWMLLTMDPLSRRKAVRKHSVK